MRCSCRSHSKARLTAWIPVAVALAGIVACGYSFRSPVPAHLNTVFVPTFQNETREFQLTQQLTERVIGEFLNESRLQLVGDEEDADLLVVGTIKSYEEEALSYDPGQAANPDVFNRRVLLTVDVRLEDQVRDETLWESASLREWGEFSEEQGETREDGIQRAIDKISEELLRHVVEEF
jgi:hypothetical protein